MNTAKREPMICKCGATMNHHAEKLIEPRDERETARTSPALGGWIEEIHECPNCGNVGWRPGE